MKKEDLKYIPITKENVIELANIALDLDLPEDDHLRINIKNWYLEHSPSKEKVTLGLKGLQTMLDNGYPQNAIAKASHISTHRLHTLIKEGKLKTKEPWELKNS